MATVPDHPRYGDSSLDNERERIIDHLTTCFSRDLLTTHEFEMRVELAQSAGSRAALADLLADLPPLRSVPAAAASAMPADQLAPPQRITAIMADTKYEGDWLRSNQISTFGLMTSVRMDFRDTPLPSEHIELQLTCIMGEITLVVPRSIEVVSHLTPIMGSVERKDRRARRGFAKLGQMIDETFDTLQSGPRATIHLRGFLLMGEVVIKYQDE